MPRTAGLAPADLVAASRAAIADLATI